MYLYILISSFVNEPSVVLLKNIVLCLQGFNNNRKMGSSPSSFFWDCLETTEAVHGVCFEIVSGINPTRTGGQWWKRKGCIGWSWGSRISRIWWSGIRRHSVVTASGWGRRGRAGSGSQLMKGSQFPTMKPAMSTIGLLGIVYSLGQLLSDRMS